MRPILWRRGTVVLLDQRRLPAVETYVECRRARDAARAIRQMVVRGAPAIGVTAAYALAAEAAHFRSGKVREDFERAARVLEGARPTAVNLRWAVERQRQVLESLPNQASPHAVRRALEREARRMMAEDIAVNRRIGELGAKAIRRRGDVLTHCNAGALATAGYGTAVGVIRALWDSGRRFRAWATETRPYLQGARLTAWELVRLGIPTTLLADSMVGSLMQQHRLAAVVVGTDRTAANGDVANKIGTYQLAVLARRHDVPFFVAAPTSSIDLDCPDGGRIPIEQRDPREVTHWRGRRVAAEGVDVYNPAFDVTPAELVTAIITEHGVVRGDFRRGLARVVARARRTIA
ncbi:MAG: S-methyl-5-thioribose-1-phosphate isomerase [Deltaproteobacteria bacterium]|nr:MAG: S-methyl-5-thioribose-1-phosphate isomerase [Deltaproteobacteria bacterium]